MPADTRYRDSSLSPEHRELRAAIARFSDEVIRPQARANDQEERYPLGILKGLSEGGFTQAAFPEELGGTDLGSLAWSLIIAEVARGSGSAGLALGVSGTASLPILHLGTPEQKEALRAVVSGDTPGVYAQSEPEQGSDVARIKTLARPAERDGQRGWAITGHKLWISNAWLGTKERAHWAVVLAQTGEVGDRRAMRFFLVPLDAPGVEAHKVRTNGMRGSGTSEMFLDRVFVPEGAMLGQGEAGFRTAMQVLGASRIFFSARGLGIVEGAVDLAAQVLERLAQASPHDGRLAPGRARWQRLEADAFSLRMLVYRVSRLRDAGEPFDHQVAILKWVAGDTALRATAEAYNLIVFLGGAPDDLMDADRMERDARQIPLAEGTSEIMERILARDLAASLRTDEGPTLGRLLEAPREMLAAFAEAQDPAQATELLLTLAEAAYREAVQRAGGQSVTHLWLPEVFTVGDEPQEMALSPIPSPRQEPLGAERALAALEVTAFQARTLADALAGLQQEGTEFPGREAALHMLSEWVALAAAQARAVFECLGDSYRWLEVASIGSQQGGPALAGMVQRVCACTLEGLSPVGRAS